MPQVRFLPSQKSATVESNTKILLAGRKAHVDIRFGCAACRCGTCGVKILNGQDQISPIGREEDQLLRRLQLENDGSIRLACQARILGDCEIDLDFQDEYSPEMDQD